MIELLMSRATGHALWYMHGPTNSDADYQAYIDSFRLIDEMAPDADPILTVLVVAEGNPPPNALWRKRIADASKSFNRNVAYALVAASPVIRGVVTAVNWLRPPPLPIRTFATFDGALDWFEKEFRSTGPLRAMHERATQIAETNDGTRAPKLLDV